jgi:Flp pilus assembly protein TadG
MTIRRYGHPASRPSLRRRLLQAPALLVALLVLPAIAFVANAVDYTTAELTKADLQEALDAAAVTVLAEIDMKSDDEVRHSLVQQIEKRLYTEEDVKTLTVFIDRKSRRVTCRATVRVEATLAGLIGAEAVDVSAMTEKTALGQY